LFQRAERGSVDKRERDDGRGDHRCRPRKGTGQTDLLEELPEPAVSAEKKQEEKPDHSWRQHEGQRQNAIDQFLSLPPVAAHAWATSSPRTKVNAVATADVLSEIQSGDKSRGADAPLTPPVDEGAPGRKPYFRKTPRDRSPERKSNPDFSSAIGKRPSFMA
jgi:hypothetical protein